MRPVIALLTDFGTRDHYVGTMKGVILGICPEATLVDLTHEVAPHDVLEGTLQLAAGPRFFPPRTIFLCVVDPGVGSSRRALAASVGEHQFVAPDNGLLTSVLRDGPSPHVVALTAAQYARPTVSRTFEGRDRFAPAAAWLANGVDLRAFGKSVTDYQLLDIPTPLESDEVLTGAVLHVDRFGNLITNIDRTRLERFAAEKKIELTIGSSRIDRIVHTYSDIAAGEAGALFGSTDHLEVSSPGRSAASLLNLHRGAVVVIRRCES